MNESDGRRYLDGRVHVRVGNVTGQRVDAIVNAANSSLMGGRGVDGAIHRAGGPQILEECREVRRALHPAGLPTGEAVITAAGSLPARYVIHTVGPVWGGGGGGEAELLASCYRRSLSLAVEHGLRTLAFPSISTGAYGYPPAEAAAVASRTIEAFLTASAALDEIRLVFFDAAAARTFVQNQEFTR